MLYFWHNAQVFILFGNQATMKKNYYLSEQFRQKKQLNIQNERINNIENEHVLMSPNLLNFRYRNFIMKTTKSFVYLFCINT